MLLWVGLGNPGAKYAGNRHNIGFLVIDAIGDDHKILNKKSQFKGIVRQGMISANGRPIKILLLKPMTFMNESGRSIRQHCGESFHRARIGIGHPGHKDKVHSYVLSDFAKAEHGIRDDICNGTARYADLLASGNRELFQTRVTEYIKG